MIRPRSAVATFALFGLIALPACDRQPRLIPASEDSTAVANADSLEHHVRLAQQRWEDPAGAEEAAALSARLVVDDLRRHLRAEPRADWQERSRAFLDSVDLGAELSSAPCVMVANFFSRANPSAGSWPWAFWCGEKGIEAQALDGRGLALLAVASRGIFGESARASGPPGIAVLYGRRGPGGQQPLLMTYTRARDRWRLAQTLGPDSLGGSGSGRFEAPADTAVHLVTRAWAPTPRFTECPTCPHLFRSHRFRWGGRGFERIATRVEPSPYASFVALVQALTTGNPDGALHYVGEPALVDSALVAGWGDARGVWRVAPGTDADALDMVFFRGSRDAWRVSFGQRGDDWVVDGFQRASRSVE